jgi:hypothetical protein
MVVRVRIKPVNLDIRVAFNGMLSPEHRSKILAQYAQEKLAEADQRNESAVGYVPEHDTFVDGVADAPLERVKPDGVIVFNFHLLGEAFRWIADELEAHSPVKSGRYEKSHVFYADGEEADPAAAPPASEYVFLNLQPYARKIEQGESPEAPEGVYEGVATMAQGRFGNIAKISFQYRTPASGAVTEWASGRRNRRRSAKQYATDTRQPAIVVTVRG